MHWPILPLCHRTRRDIAHAPAPSALHKISYLHHGLLVESFNGTFRAECLNTHRFTTLHEGRQLIEAWRREYNESRLHRLLGEKTPSEFAASRKLAQLKPAED